ncbi:Leucine-rich repeat neuronal protein 2 [Sarcoptes scabiei]|uniref:Leucine-rich repeat neuronal protein 2 n=1 Tax=Sarcoptes scabiei TaxID=52283 RepID=A0A834R623_SARSC|nr:Leucine-rich repeat neuronal protein 2 [Sarcoptes scabiei]
MRSIMFDRKRYIRNKLKISMLIFLFALIRGCCNESQPNINQNKQPSSSPVASNDQLSMHKHPQSEICRICFCQEEERDDVKDRNHFVYCQHRHLNRIPAINRLPPRTKFLNLAMNNITSIEKFETMEDLNHLILAINGLKQIEPFAFEQLPNLIALDLSFNELSKLPESVFETLSELQYLNLSNNHLEYLPLEMFKKNGYLFELNLQHNRISYINSMTFSPLKQLEILNLAHNSLYSLQTDLFIQLDKLKRLILSQNEFQGTPINALRQIKRLEFLDLSSNPIRVLNEASFYNLYTLRELRMNKMPLLIRIETRTFSSLNNLTILDLNDNPRLAIIDTNAFYGLFHLDSIKLQRISLRRNQIRKISEHTLPFCNLTYLDLRENPWQCDCHVHWIKYCHGSKNFEQDIVCNSPDRLIGHELMAIPFSELVCETIPDRFQSNNYLFIFSIFFMTGLLISVLMLIFRNQITSFYGNKTRKEGSIYYVRAQSNLE